MKHVIIVSGPNGAGKSTIAPSLLNEALNVSHYVNADTIAMGLSAFSPESVSIQAGKVMLSRLKMLAQENENFAFETTLASKTFLPWLKKLKNDGYAFHLIFIHLSSSEMAISRVNERVKLGGHFVPNETVIRRFHAGLKNFFNLYKPIANFWYMYDNTFKDNFNLVASGHDQNIFVFNDILWNDLEKNYDKTNA